MVEVTKKSVPEKLVVYSQEVVPGSTHTLVVPVLSESMRIDVFLAASFERYSRSFFKRLIEENVVFKNGKLVERESMRVNQGDMVIVQFPLLRDRTSLIQAAQLKEGSDKQVELLFEHADFLIINKPARFMVHAPSQRSMAFTLSDWLVMKFDEIEKVGYDDRPGIVHRLDRDTTGIMVIPRSPWAHARLADMFKERRMSKMYKAIVEGLPDQEGVVEYPIARHPIERNKMTHILPSGRNALTHYAVDTYFAHHALLDVRIFTGRTHQIRVHCNAIGHPILGDPIYGHKSKLIKRQALHAYSLSFEWNGQQFAFKAPLPDDMTELIRYLANTSEFEPCPEEHDPSCD